MSRAAYITRRMPGPGTTRPDAEPSGAVDLRAIWPNLSSEQRDSLVGRALGATPGLRWTFESRATSENRGSLWYDTEHELAAFLSRHPALGKRERISREFWPLYSETWDGFGQIMDECICRRWPASLVYRGVAQETVYATVKGCNSDEVAGGPEALALAFCMAADVEVPAEWIEAAGA